MITLDSIDGQVQSQNFRLAWRGCRTGGPPQPPPPPVQPAAPEPAPEAAPAPAIDPLANLKLSGILGNETGGLAAINNRIYKVGDTVRRGLTIQSIDARTNTVILRQSDGSELKLHRKD